MIGILGDVTFVSTAFKLLTLNGLARKSDPEISTHNVIGKKPVLEFVAPGIEEIEFNIRLDEFYGVNPIGEITRLRGYRDTGLILPLVLDMTYQGDFVITDLSETHKNIDGKGKTTIAEIKISLSEVGWNPENINLEALQDPQAEQLPTIDIINRVSGVLHDPTAALNGLIAGVLNGYF